MELKAVSIGDVSTEDKLKENTGARGQGYANIPRFGAKNPGPPRTQRNGREV
jgi:hypothetical protein